MLFKVKFDRKHITRYADSVRQSTPPFALISAHFEVGAEWVSPDGICALVALVCSKFARRSFRRDINASEVYFVASLLLCTIQLTYLHALTGLNNELMLSWD